MGRYLLKSLMTEEARSRLLRLLFSVSDVLSDNGITFWVDRGALLGGFRRGELIAGDGDIDFRMLHDEWPKAYRALRRDLPGDLAVTAHHHGAEINDLYEAESAPWFRNKDGVFPVAEHESHHGGTYFHTATALAVNVAGESWRKAPNLDIYCCRINSHHDCTPSDWEKPWKSDGRRYLCIPSRKPTNRLTPYELIFPLGEIELEGRIFPAPAKCQAYLEYIYGYLGEDAVYDDTVQHFVKSPDGKPRVL